MIRLILVAIICLFRGYPNSITDFYMHCHFHISFGSHVRQIFCFFLIFSLVITGWSSHSFAKSNPKYASIVLDARSGMVLSQENADRTLFPASLTKIMTMVMVFDALDAKKLTPNSRLVASSHSASMPPSKVGLKPGQTISVHDALRVLATKSANDIAVVVAENLGGTELRFAQLMNLKARIIGLNNTHFVNASGLHDYRQYSTARDMAKLAKYVIDTYPQYYNIFGISNFHYQGKSYHNHNKLMGQYKGMDGLKTGYVAASGFNLVSSARRGDARLIGVVFGGRTAQSRNSQMATLLDRGFEKMAELKSSGRIILRQALVEPAEPSALYTSYSSVPTPPRKPGQDVAFPTQAIANDVTQQISQTQGMQTMIVSKAPSTNISGLTASLPSTPSVPVTGNSSGWQIQIGAYEDRTACNTALYQAMTKLPRSLNKGQTVVFPLRTQDSKWIFRARLAGYTHQEALAACAHFKECMAIPPSTTP